MCLHIFSILTGQGHISKVMVVSKASEGSAEIISEVIPLEAEFFCHHYFLSRLIVNEIFQSDNFVSFVKVQHCHT